MKKDILKIGVTGSAGSGKSLVCKAFGRLGLVTLDCDRIARQVVEPGQKAYNKVVAIFGTGVVAGDNSLDRAKLRKIIVSRPELRKQLEGVLHPMIIREMLRQMETADYRGEPACAVEVPLLFELGMEGYFDVLVTVATEEGTLVERICARDNVDEAAAGKMLALQMGQEEKIKRADHVIYNRGSAGDLFSEVSGLYKKLLKQRLTKK
ncbi:MAG: dephospho-CoA kinase [Desulfobacterales bacterium]|nr:dephospho-CoA kinase [Desulfobacterales bacterium]